MDGNLAPLPVCCWEAIAISLAMVDLFPDVNYAARNKLFAERMETCPRILTQEAFLVAIAEISSAY